MNEDLRRSEYRFSPVPGEEGVWSAPNRSQDLRSRVSAEGIEVFPRSAGTDGAGAEWRLSIRTKRFGREGDLLELGIPSPRAGEKRVELDHGPLVEWFENRGEGIEQGWTIATRPPGVDALEIELEVEGLGLRIDEGHCSGVFVDAAGKARLRYRELRAFDATGRELTARLEPTARGIGVRIRDRGALYPITVDPVLTGPAWTAEGDKMFADFGFSVASAGDVNGDGFSDVIVGAPGYDNGESSEGRAFVYLGSSSGLSTGAAWTAESDQALAVFGSCVACAGDVNGDGYCDVIVGAPRFDNGESEEGRAYVYLGSSSGLVPTAGWTAESDQASAFFAYSGACAGDVNGDGYSDVIVGASEYTNGQAQEGRAYVYLGSSGGLATSAAWTAESDQTFADFGLAVASAGDVNGDGYGDVIVGADTYTNGQSQEGRSFVYLGSASGLAASAAWTGESNQAGAFFGISVASAGDVNGDGYGDVIVGADDYDNGQTSEGRAYLYLGSSGGLATSAAWTVESDQNFAIFGDSVASAGDVNADGYSDVIVGSFFYANGEADEGHAFVYLGSSGGLATVPAWTGESNQVSAEYGYSVAGAGDVNGDGYSDVIVGAHYYDNGESDEGRAYVYLGSAGGLATGAAWTAESDQVFADTGYSVASAGDVNGDGYSDVIVSARRYDDTQVDEGRVSVHHGSSSGLSTSADWAHVSGLGYAEFGTSVATAGDVNGDGYGDVIIGMPLYGGVTEGLASVYDGSSSGLSTTSAWEASGLGYSAFGTSVSTAGDVNGDGYSDVIVGDPYSYFGNDGHAYLYGGSSSGLSTSATWDLSGLGYSQFGTSVFTAGDVNGDGYSDVIVGAPYLNNGESDEGGVYAYLGSATGVATSAAWTAESDQVSALFGSSVSTAGDVNGDGFSDVIVGAPYFDNGQADEGRAFVYLGSASGLVTTAAWVAESDQVNAHFGVSVSTAGDVNGDGYSDVIVGAFEYDNGQTDEGRAFVYLGSATGLATGAAWVIESNQANANLGVSVASAGDVNGDGYGDVIVGADRYTNGQSEEGRAFVYLGNEGRGGAGMRGLQQLRIGDPTPIALLGLSDTIVGFRIRATFDRDLAGFSWASALPPTARLQWEVKGLGRPLDGSAVESGDPLFLTGTPLTFVQPNNFDLIGEVQHWRARVRTNNPLFPVTPWMWLPGNGVTEGKIRTGFLPGLGGEIDGMPRKGTP